MKGSNNLSLYTKKLEKEEQSKCKVRKSQEIQRLEWKSMKEKSKQ